MEAFAKEVHGEVGAVDILVNNAGVYLTGGFLDLSLKDWDWVLSVNLWGIIHGCHYFVPPMVERGVEGHVVNVASMFGYWPSPDVIGYLTAKFGVFGFSEALREDLRRHGIGVSTICPGIVNTGLLRRMRMRHAGADEAAARSMLEAVYERRDYKPERVAAAILRAIRRNRARVMVAPESWLMYRVERFWPALSRFVARRAAGRMFGAKTGKHPLRPEEQ